MSDWPSSNKRTRGNTDPEHSELQGLSAFIRYRAAKNKARAPARLCNTDRPPQIANPPNPLSRRAAKKACQEGSPSSPTPPSETSVEHSNVPESKQERIARLQAELAVFAADTDEELPDAPVFNKPGSKKSTKTSSLGDNPDLIAYSDDKNVGNSKITQ
ncbi:hypothetical protein BJ508DRAFT_336082 [Ascobolus immersus RN42]|uniref:Uncharacterized protein n=1 Tax=Ascobolus immersus RN42 TaxID=1160509 RepID=A0A3N4H9T1_ASCIM|nr:hypothetical protein BJ508DRAFT_336082 [Ascobolus immersus RN42]